MTLNKEQTAELTKKLLDTIAEYASVNVKDLTVNDAVYCLGLAKKYTIMMATEGITDDLS